MVFYYILHYSAETSYLPNTLPFKNWFSTRQQCVVSAFHYVKP